MSFWSAEAFVRGNIEGWPFEYDYILCYRGTSREIFFPKEHSTDLSEKYGMDDEYRLPSVLNTRYLIPENNFGTQHGNTALENWRNWYIEKVQKEEGLTEDEAERVWKEFLKSGKENRVPEMDEMLDTKEPGVFFAPKNIVKARDYFDPNTNGSIMLKLKIPTNSIVVNNRRDDKDNIRCKNLSMMERQFTKEEFKHICETAVQYGNKEVLQYITADASLKWITGVMDPDHPKEGFIELGKYVQWLKKECFWEMEKFSFDVETHASIKDEIDFLEQIAIQLKKLEYYLQIIEEKREEVIEEFNQENVLRYKQPASKFLRIYLEYLETILKCIEGKNVKGPGFDQTLKETEELIDKEFSYFEDKYTSKFHEGFKTSTKHTGRQIKNLKSLKEVIPREIEEIEKIREEEVEELEKKLKEDYSEEYKDAERFKKKIGFEWKADRNIFSEIENIPRINGIKEEIESRIKIVREDLELIREGKNPDLSKYQDLPF